MVGILTDDMKRVVREQRLGFIATVCADGTPNLSPKGTTNILDDDNLVFADICSPGTIENLQGNPAIEINVVDPMVRKGYRFKGRATIVESGDQFDEIMSSVYATMSEAIRKRVQRLVVVRVERTAPLISPAYDTGATEDEVQASWEEYWRMVRAGATVG